jgi:hypothetical protein
MVAPLRPRDHAVAAVEKRRGAPFASEPPVTAPSTRRRVLLWRASAQPEVSPLPQRVKDAKVFTRDSRFPEFLNSRVRRLALGVLVGALLALASDVAWTRFGASSHTSSTPATATSHPASPGGCVAFLFLTRGPVEGLKALPHDHLWGRFLCGQDQSAYLVRVHAPPGFVFDASNTEAPDIFIGTELKHPVHPVEWGGISVVKAERALLRSALLSENPRPERFALLSESCIPIRPFHFVREYLFDGDGDGREIRAGDDRLESVRGVESRGGFENHRRDASNDSSGKYHERAYTPKSYVESAPDRQARWPGFRNASAREELPKRHWRKGAQWFVLTRAHAELVSSDQTVVKRFEEHCYSSSGGGRRDAKRDNFCIPDEHYVPTLLSMLNVSNELESRSVTYANWWPTTRWHPKRYAVQETRDAVFLAMRKFETDDAFQGYGEHCGWYRGGPKAGLRKPCWLFARKMTEKSGRRIGKFAGVQIGY